MKRLLITLLLAFVALPIFAQVEQDCGAIDCPGRCGRFIDQNGDGFCDRGRLSEAAKPAATVTTAEPQKAEKSEPETQAQKQPATSTPAKRVHNEEAPSHNDIAAEDAHTDATQLEEPQPQPQPVEPVQEEETAPANGGSPYHLVLITLLTIPFIMAWTTSLVGETAGISLPVGNLIGQNLLLMLLPVLLGIGLNYAWPKGAGKVDRVLAKLAFPLLLVLITVFYVQHRVTILQNIGTLGLCVTLLILLAIGCSALLSRLVRNDARQRWTVVIEVGMQNAAQAIAIASSPLVFANEEMAIPAILYSLMMNIVLLIYVGVVRRKNAAV